MSYDSEQQRNQLEALRAERETISAELDLFRSGALVMLASPSIANRFAQLEAQFAALSAEIAVHERGLK